MTGRSPNIRVELDGERLSGESFDGIRGKVFFVRASQFTNCTFRNLQVDEAVLGARGGISTYEDCTFDGMTFKKCMQTQARFERCSFEDVHLREMFCFETEFVGCVFSGTLDKVVFNGTPRPDEPAVAGRSSNEFRGNDFRRVHLNDVSFRTGIELTDQRFPDDPSYLVVRDADRLLIELQRIADVTTSPLLSAALANELGRRRRQVEEGQRQLFIERALYTSTARTEVFEAIKEAATYADN